ncbi:MAG: sigma-E factor negative regulatory protein [Ferrovum sp.]|nr:sigma-E factor negative regulatory protein [Ferrovum sp.]NDU87513.1 sigma-E factor negative regulatory protein [Ferrovum sp.]
MENDKMEHLSAAIDGELDKDKFVALLAKCKRDEEFHEQWYAYHLIGDMLRESTLPPVSIHERVLAALKDEPTILLPGITPLPQETAVTPVRRWFAVAAAVAVVFLTTAVLRPTPPAAFLAQTEVAPVKSEVALASPPIDPDIDTFVALHHQGSPLSGIQAVDYTPQTSSVRH